MKGVLNSKVGRAVMRLFVWVGVCAAAFGALALMSLAFPEETTNVFATVVTVLLCALIVAAMVAFVVAMPGWILWIGCIPVPFKIIAVLVAVVVVESLVTGTLIPQWTDAMLPTLAGSPAFDAASIVAIAAVVAVAVLLNRALDRAIAACEAPCLIDEEKPAPALAQSDCLPKGSSL